MRHDKIPLWCVGIMLAVGMPTLLMPSWLMPQLAAAVYGANSVWEIRSAAVSSALYGGFYDATCMAVVGTDYTQQDTPYCEVNDGTTDGAGTVLGSASFPAMTPDDLIGNGVYITNAGTATAGWYTILDNDATTITIDASAGASKTGCHFAVGGSNYLTDAVMEGQAVGNTTYIQAGTYTLTADVLVTGPVGTLALPMNIIGYSATRTDKPTGSNRPLVACGSYRWQGTYWRMRYLRGTSSSASWGGLTGGTTGVLDNCQGTNTSSGPGISGITGGTFVNCSGSSATGAAFSSGSNYGTWLGCYAYDSAIGFRGSQYAVAHCVSDTCTNGAEITGGTGQEHSVVNCTFYSGTNGIIINTGVNHRVAVYNCIISSFTTGIKSVDANLGAIYEDYNDIFNCTTDRTNVTAGPNDYDLDPEFADAAGGDFRVGENCKAKGFPGTVPGAAATCIGYLDTGAVQRVEGTAATVYQWGGAF